MLQTRTSANTVPVIYSRIARILLVVSNVPVFLVIKAMVSIAKVRTRVWSFFLALYHSAPLISYNVIRDRFIVCLDACLQISTSVITRYLLRDAWKTPNVAISRRISYANANLATSATARCIARMWTSARYLERVVIIRSATIFRGTTLVPVNLGSRETPTKL